MRYELDTENAGCDEVLTGDSIEEVTQNVLNRYEFDELPEGWSITPIPIELAVKGTHGDWEFLGDYPSVDAAKSAAKEYAALGQHHIDAYGVMVFGISDDPDSGHYETTYSVEVTTGGAAEARWD